MIWLAYAGPCLRLGGQAGNKEAECEQRKYIKLGIFRINTALREETSLLVDSPDKARAYLSWELLCAPSLAFHLLELWV